MKIDVKILDEITRNKKINNYVLEQAAPPPLPTGEETPTDTTPAPPSDIVAPAPPTDTTTGTTEPQKVDLKTDTEVEKVGDEGKRKKEIEVMDHRMNDKIKLGALQQEISTLRIELEMKNFVIDDLLSSNKMFFKKER